MKSATVDLASLSTLKNRSFFAMRLGTLAASLAKVNGLKWNFAKAKLNLAAVGSDWYQMYVGLICVIMGHKFRFNILKNCSESFYAKKCEIELIVLKNILSYRGSTIFS